MFTLRSIKCMNLWLHGGNRNCSVIFYSPSCGSKHVFLLNTKDEYTDHFFFQAIWDWGITYVGVILLCLENNFNASGSGVEPGLYLQ